jgi:hypothetical protein
LIKKQKVRRKNIKRITEARNPVDFKEHPPQYPEENTSWLSYYNTEFKWLDKHHVMLKLYTGSFL